MNTKTKNSIAWASQIIVAVIFLQTLFFKFTAHPESVAIFTSLGVEPWGRIALGVVELIAGIAILVPKTARPAAMVTGIISIGAIISHIVVLGINSLFAMAVVTLILSLVVIKLRTR